MSSYVRGKEPKCPEARPGCTGIIRKVGGQCCQACFKALKHEIAKGVDIPTQQLHESRSETATTCEITKAVTDNVRTLEDLIRVCEIDLETWDIERWVCNKWEVAAKTKPTGHSGNWSRDNGNLVHAPLFQIKVWLKRKTVQDLTMKKLKADLLDDIRTEVHSAPPVHQSPHIDSQWLFEFSPFDLHMGKFAWGEECVTDYDVDIAEDLFNGSLDFLLDRALKLTDGRLDRILCVFGNDVCHVDSKRLQTTAGTQMDFDSRYPKVYRRICKIHRRAIDILRQFAPVDVKMVPGNHDELTSFHLGEILATRYEDDPNVTVDNSAKLTKYYNYGVNLFGFTHGDSERVTELPLKMAREQPELWAKCPSREWHIGHKHISEKFDAKARTEQDYFSDKGVRIRRLTSLSGHDAWHTKHAYMDRRACEAFVFHKTAGFTDQLSFNVDHFTGKGLDI